MQTNRRHFNRVLFLLVVTALVFSITSVLPALAATGTFSNTTPILIPATGTSGPAAPYPSTINVSGFVGSVIDVNVSTLAFNHTFPDDVDVLLVGPTGQTVLLMSDAGGSADTVNVNLTFDQSAGASIPDAGPTVSGTFLPSNFGTGDTFPAPAPIGPFGASLDGFNGTNPNGTWSLYVFDDVGGDVGNFNGGWSLEITDDAGAPAITSPATAAGVVGTAFNHTFTATGGPAPTFSYTNENLPPGVTRTGDTLSGTPTLAGTYTIDATASNGVAPDAFQTLTITVTDLPVIPAAAPPPPPVPTCNQIGSETSTVVRAQAADGTVTDGAVFCRVLAENGSFKGDSGQVGNAGLIAMGIWQAVDVFGLTAGGNPVVPFNHPVYVCLSGTGTLYYADASNAPRVYGQIASSVQDGFTCASIPNAGTLVLIGSGNMASEGH